jgi:hypothetical protein
MFYQQHIHSAAAKKGETQAREFDPIWPVTLDKN